MVEFTTNEWVILGLVFLLGWLVGLASRSGGRRWKRSYHDERESHTAYRRESGARIAAANERIAALEQPAPAIGTASAVGATAHGQRDDLSQIRGIGPDLESRLNECGVHSFRDIARLSRSDQAALEGRLGLKPGRIDRQAWRDQAAMLAKGRSEEHHSAFG